MTESWHRQEGFTVRFEWGPTAARELADLGDVVVVVDVLCFSTTVSVATGRGIRVQPVVDAHVIAPSPWPVAVRREDMDDAHPWSLSPASARTAPEVHTVVLPSPNGASISTAVAALGATVFAGCLRNARATAIAALRAARGVDPAGQRRRPFNSVLVIAAGERWSDGSLRPAIEDLLGAGAVMAALHEVGDVSLDDFSPEALVALRAWRDLPDARDALLNCASGRELLLRGFGDDVSIALELDAATDASMLIDGSFTAVPL